jgi:hypothetical protein
MFTIERSETGETWESIATVDAGGNKVKQQSYEGIDANPLSEAYYRLRIDDLDGSSYYSNIISLERNNSDLKLNGLYPNPNKGLFTLDISSRKGTDVQIAVMNYLGVEVFSKTLIGGSDIQQMDVSQLSAGVYALFVRQGDLVDSQRIVITE